MKVRRKFCLIALIANVILCVAVTQAQSNANSSVKGSGTVDRVTKWVDDREIGDSEIIETGGNVGIGTAPTTSKLTVAGRIQANVTGVNAALLGISPDGSGVVGTSSSGSGVLGESSDLIGVHGISTNFIGVRGFSSPGFGVVGQSTSGTGVFGRSISGFAGRFVGNVEVTGTLSKGGGSFKIDHPLDPENKFLYHSFVESPDMMNIYNGNVVTNENGEAVVELPEYFEALNRDFRYQLTVVGTFAQAIVGEKVKANRFTIKTNAPGVEVSWQVTGIRHDAWANRNRIPVEEVKPDLERGYYLYPEAFDQPPERSLEQARELEFMRQVKQQRIERTKSKEPDLR